ncbi:hypothetical protein MKK70_13470 [Methylobacterium sp. E-041]|uniref:hypothetical protein n=1 Tax=Methylobacterium sp. E-041 TaxID=2836573 RepID=UPI001FBAC785|nr:hypothetical protein [Methylobacterium sp. E-041]MCJ2106373.1 hypothetical protein [Methylobacterium sp. E-041]
MDQMNHSLAEAMERTRTSSRNVREPTVKPEAGNLVLLTAASEERDQNHNQDEVISPAEKWLRLLERVQDAARYIRDIEDRAQEQEFRVQELLEQVRVDMDSARARALTAERHAREVEMRAAKLIQAAEERAVAAEQMLQRISQTIEAEFAVPPSDRQPQHSRTYTTRVAS